MLKFSYTVGFDINQYGAQTVPMRIRHLLIDFNRAMGKDRPIEPEWPSPEKVQLALDLITEEVDELHVAIGNHDMVEVADALADIAYVVEAAFQAFGINSEPVIAEVHRSNLSKTDGVRRDDGKVLKGPNCSPPRIYEVLDAQAAK